MTVFDALRLLPEDHQSRAVYLALRFLKHRTSPFYDTRRPRAFGEHIDHFEPEDEQLAWDLLGEIEREEGCLLRELSDETAGSYVVKLHEVSSERIRRELEAMRLDGSIAKIDAILESFNNTPLHYVPRDKPAKSSRGRS